MNYEELIAKALKGRSVNSMAKAWGVPQPTLDTYVKGKAIPDFDTALKMVREAGVTETEAWEALAEKTRLHRATKFRLQSGVVQPQVLALLTIASICCSFHIMSNRMAKLASKFKPYKRFIQSHHAAYV